MDLGSLEDAGEEYIGQTDLKEGLDVARTFQNLAQQGKDALGVW